MAKFILCLCFWPFILFGRIIGSLFKLLGVLLIGASIDSLVFGKR